MVQFTDHNLFGDNNAHADRLDPYWKLDNGNQYDNQYDKQTLLGILESKNYSCASNTSQARIQELYARCQRGLLSYKGMKAPELQFYVAQRKLPVPAGRPRLFTTV